MLRGGGDCDASSSSADESNPENEIESECKTENSGVGEEGAKRSVLRQSSDSSSGEGRNDGPKQTHRSGERRNEEAQQALSSAGCDSNNDTECDYEEAPQSVFGIQKGILLFQVC